MAATLAFLHVSPQLIAPFDALGRELMPSVALVHRVDESLLRDTIGAGRLEKAIVRRVAEAVLSALDAGADAVMVTCSTIAPAVDIARALADAPVLRVDEPMAEAAVRVGPRVGVVATLASTLEPTSNLLRMKAAAAGRVDMAIESVLCPGAAAAAAAGDLTGHDKIVAEQVRGLMDRVDVVVLAQVSMARVADLFPATPDRAPVLASPRLAMEQARRVLAVLGRDRGVIGAPERAPDVRGAC